MLREVGGVLFIVHAETCFLENYFERAEFELDLASAIFNREHDAIYVLCSEVGEESSGEDNLIPLVRQMVVNGSVTYTTEGGSSYDCPVEYINWSYGYEKGQVYSPDKDLNKDGTDPFVILADNSPHEWTWISPELRAILPDMVNENLRHIWLCGGGDQECLEDFRAILRHYGLDWSEKAVY